MRNPKSAASYLNRLKAPVLTPEHRLANLKVLLDLNRDVINRCVADKISRSMTATIIELDEQARVRGVPDPISMALDLPSARLYRETEGI